MKVMSRMANYFITRVHPAHAVCTVNRLVRTRYKSTQKRTHLHDIKVCDNATYWAKQTNKLYLLTEQQRLNLALKLDQSSKAKRMIKNSAFK